MEIQYPLEVGNMEKVKNCFHCNAESIWPQNSSNGTANNAVVMAHKELVQWVRSIVHERPDRRTLNSREGY